MNRTLIQYPARFPLTAGALVRRAVRRILQRLGIEYTEERGLIDSQFMVTITSGQQGRALQSCLKELNGDV